MWWWIRPMGGSNPGVPPRVGWSRWVRAARGGPGVVGGCFTCAVAGLGGVGRALAGGGGIYGLRSGGAGGGRLSLIHNGFGYCGAALEFAWSGGFVGGGRFLSRRTSGLRAGAGGVRAGGTGVGRGRRAGLRAGLRAGFRTGLRACGFRAGGVGAGARGVSRLAWARCGCRGSRCGIRESGRRAGHARPTGCLSSGRGRDAGARRRGGGRLAAVRGERGAICVGGQCHSAIDWSGGRGGCRGGRLVRCRGGPALGGVWAGGCARACIGGSPGPTRSRIGLRRSGGLVAGTRIRRSGSCRPRLIGRRGMQLGLRRARFHSRRTRIKIG